MKTKIYLTFFLSSLLASCSNLSTSTSWDKYGLKDEVKLFIETSYSVEKQSNQWVEQSILSKSQVLFNEQGIVLEQKTENLKMISELEGNQIKKVLGYLNDTQTVVSIIEEYSSKKMKYKTFSIDEGEFNFDSDSFLEIEELYGEYGVTKFVSRSYFNGKIFQEQIITYDYNDKGYLISESEERGGDVHLEMDIKYEYLEFDEKGNWLKRLHRG